MARELPEERGVFLPTMPAGRGQSRLAGAMVLVSIAVFLAATPFGQVPFSEVKALIPMYESALLIIDLIAAILCSGALCIIACALHRRWARKNIPSQGRRLAAVLSVCGVIR